MLSFQHTPHARGYFVTGTDTGIGKTVVSAWLTLHLKADYWKPVQSGTDEETDLAAVVRMTGLPPRRFHAPTYELSSPLSPHESARLDDVTIDMERFKLPKSSRTLIVEGAGGLLVPLTHEALMIDLIDRLSLPVILVARSGLGTINHTLLSLEALRRRDIPITGVVMSGEINTANRQAIESFGCVDIIGEIPPLQKLDPSVLTHLPPPRL